MSPRRKKVLTRGHLMAWVVSLGLGIGWVLLLESLPSGVEPVATLLLAMTGIFGFLLGAGIATGVLVWLLRIMGTRPGSVSTPEGKIPPDRVFGIFVMLFCLPSMFVYFVG
jgi:hypothetical protein